MAQSGFLVVDANVHHSLALERNIPRPTAQRFIALMRRAGLLHTARLPRGRRGGVYVFTELIEIVEGRALR